MDTFITIPQKFFPSLLVQTSNRIWRIPITDNSWISKLMSYFTLCLILHCHGTAIRNEVPTDSLMPLDAQWWLHYCKMRLHFSILFCVLRESRNICFHPRGILTECPRRPPTPCSCLIASAKMWHDSRLTQWQLCVGRGVCTWLTWSTLVSHSFIA